MTYPYNIEQFITGYLTSRGAICERPAYGIVESLVEENIDGLNSDHLIMGFDYEAAQEWPEAQFISYGSTLYTRIVESALSKHLCAMRYVEPAVTTPRNLEQKLATRLAGSNGKIHIAGMKLYLARCMRFQFKVAFLSDQIEEHLVKIWIDAHSGNQIAYHDIPHIFFQEKRSLLLPGITTLPLVKLFAQSLHALSSQIESRRKELTFISAAALAQDTATTESYFNSLAEEAKLRLAKAKLAGNSSATEKDQHKLASIEEQKRHHLHDIKARHSIGVEITLLDVVGYEVPRWRVSYTDNRSRGAEQTATVWWDEVLKRFL